MKDIMDGISPLPWREKGIDEWGESTQRLVKNGEDCTIAITCDKPTAAYIVHACNLYPELVEALDDIANGTSHGDTCSYELTPDTAVCDCHRAIAANALAKCKAGAE